MAWLVCDYGEVISFAPGEGDVARLARLCGAPTEGFAAAYWSRRAEYDRGALDAGDFFSSLAPCPLDAESLERCIRSDVESWTHLDPIATRAIESCEARGWRLALLSNAPREIARALDSIEWFSRFEHRVFSCDVGAVKPEPAIYATLLEVLGADPSAVTFVDDREANVAAAAAAGIRSLRYDGPEVFSSL